MMDIADITCTVVRVSNVRWTSNGTSNSGIRNIARIVTAVLSLDGTGRKVTYSITTSKARASRK